MRSLSLGLLLLLPLGGSTLLTAGCSSVPKITPWEVTQGMDAPESACVYEGMLFVSQVGAGGPTDKDGNGRISLLTLQGVVVKTDWITGLNAPKGLRTTGGTLWAADIDEIVEIDISAAKVVKKHKVDGAKFLNDVATGPDGAVYVSDMALSRIYRVKDGKISIFAEGEDLEYPNGLLVDGDSLVLGGWGKPEADFSTKVPGRLLKIDLQTK